MKTRGFEFVDFGHIKNKGDIVRSLPIRGTKNAMGYDFICPKEITIEPGKTGKIWTDVKAYMNDDECLIINVRSSMGGSLMLANTAGWIDSDYYSNKDNDGNIGIFLYNMSDEVYTIKAGDRIAQGAFFKFLKADNCNTDISRVGGFGSTNSLEDSIDLANTCLRLHNKVYQTIRYSNGQQIRIDMKAADTILIDLNAEFEHLAFTFKLTKADIDLHNFVCKKIREMSY